MELISEAANLIIKSKAIFIGAGAGMGVDSGLPDFRGDSGFWKAYPPLKKLGISFVEMANPEWFLRDPRLAWGFYGHRLNLYRSVKPHNGIHLLRKWGEMKNHGAFVFTSNVDGHFQKAGFSAQNILECHGSIHHLQCSGRCQKVWSAKDVHVEVDESSMRAVGTLPVCLDCGEIARPNILMFGDWGFNGEREQRQSEHFYQWLERIDGPVAFIECGAGKSVPTVRVTMERMATKFKSRLIRINPRQSDVPPGHLGIQGNAREVLEQIQGAIDLLM